MERFIKIKNQRLLIILCTDCKLSTKIQTIILNKYLHRILDADQRGFRKDCYIGSNILDLQHLIDYVNENNIDGLLMCPDFENAFDTIE